MIKLLSRRLRRASYNGIRFEVDGSDLTFGRRTVTHEYPQRDVPYVEDLGKATRKITLSAFVVGEDFIDRANRLIKAIENPKTTPDGMPDNVLVHPWLGRLKVVAIDSPKVSWDLKLGFAKLTLQFVEAGELKNPLRTTEWSSRLLGLADDLYSKMFGDLDLEEYSGYIDDIVSGCVGCLGVIKDSSFAKMFNLAEDVADLTLNLASLFGDGRDALKDAVLNATGIAEYANTTQNWRKSTSSIKNTLNSSSMSSAHSEAVALTDISTQKQQTVTRTIDTFQQGVRLAMLGNALGSAAYVATSLDQNEEGTIVAVTSEEVLGIRDDLMDTLEAEMIRTEDDDDDLYLTLSDSFAAVYNKLTADALALGSTLTVTPSEPTPSLVLAYDQYGEASRDLEVVQRNNIANPLFVSDTIKMGS